MQKRRATCSIELSAKSGYGRAEYTATFAKNPNDVQTTSIGEDGLPVPGRLYRKDDPYYSARDKSLNSYRIGKFHSVEAAYCGIVRLVTVENEGAVVSI